MARFEIFPHMDAIARSAWHDAETRPLTEIGWKQAEFIAEQILAGGPVHGLFASSSTRSWQSLEPLARRTGLSIQPLSEFEVLPRPAGEPRDPLEPAHQAGRNLAELQRIQTANPDGRYVLCSNGGDIITSLMAFIAGKNGQPIPPKLEVSIGPAGSDLRRGNIYSVAMSPDSITFEQKEALPEFPQAVPQASAASA
jgi:hypothetical protein